MKLRIEANGHAYTLDLEPNGSGAHYSLQGSSEMHGNVSVEELTPGIFSVLLGYRSFTVYMSEKDGVLEALTASERHMLSITDARDRASATAKTAAAGPVEIRSQMPGKVVKLLVTPGAAVAVGDGVIVVEAMKMQNEMKSPKTGVVSHIRVQEGATVAAGETMIVIE